MKFFFFKYRTTYKSFQTCISVVNWLSYSGSSLISYNLYSLPLPCDVSFSGLWEFRFWYKGKNKATLVRKLEPVAKISMGQCTLQMP